MRAARRAVCSVPLSSGQATSGRLLGADAAGLDIGPSQIMSPRANAESAVGPTFGGTTNALRRLAMTPSGGDIIANRFRLVRELGRGGMGSVWLADHLTLEVRCAVKLIAGEGVCNPKYILRLHEEARTMAQVQSPHVVRVLDHDVCGDVPYIAMELLEGEDLRARLMREGVLDPLATYKIISQIARGLAKAHAVGVVHRDLKPENVFLAEDDDQVIVKLLDFGIANSAASRVAPAEGSGEGEGLGRHARVPEPGARGRHGRDRLSGRSLGPWRHRVRVPDGAAPLPGRDDVRALRRYHGGHASRAK